ncbi:MAG TPA: HipA family kinase, partial [Gemmatimonadaceae bacterium]|nr:HipA family kinase [Gemmatimonadaceae bacterium]
METLAADRISAAGRRGSSRPIIAETSGGARFVKLRGAGQGTGALVAEVIVAALAETLGLFVPPRSLIVLRAGIDVADWDDELADLLGASIGVNLGFDFLNGARDFVPADAARVPASTRAAIFWLDRFVMNPDRTTQNPNLLWWLDHLWLIDHGASLGFQYAWERVTESSPRDPRLSRDAHVFEAGLSPDDVAAADAAFAPLVTREVLTSVVAAVDETFLVPLVRGATGATGAIEAMHEEQSIARRRAAYVAYLWKRVQSPRSFLELRAGLATGP